jgi:integrase
MASKSQRRDHGSGSIYQRSSDGRWIGTFESGWTSKGTRRRITVSAKTQAECKRRLRDKRLAVDRGELGTSERTTVKAWAETYLEMRRRDLSPKGYNAAASPIRKWIVPTIGHRRLAQLTPADVRAVADAQRAAGRQAADTHRVLKTMLKAAIAEGHPVPERLLHMDAPKVGKSDRRAMTVDQGLACIEEASRMPNGVRWLFTLVYGQRMGECLGLTWDAVDLIGHDEAPYGEAVIEWQLQPLPYNRPRDRSSGFRVPDDHEARHLVDAYHLVRPKSRAGYRVAPLLAPVRDALLAWRQVAPESPHGLVWPEPNGRPRNDKHDRAEWHELQARAGVAHPSGRPYHVHECRNFAATMLLDAEVPEHVIEDLLGHSALATSLKYRTRRRGPLLDAMQRVGERLHLERGGRALED